MNERKPPSPTKIPRLSPSRASTSPKRDKSISPCRSFQESFDQIASSILPSPELPNVDPKLNHQPNYDSHVGQKTLFDDNNIAEASNSAEIEVRQRRSVDVVQPNSPENPYSGKFEVNSTFKPLKDDFKAANLILTDVTPVSISKGGAFGLEKPSNREKQVDSHESSKNLIQEISFCKSKIGSLMQENEMLKAAKSNTVSRPINDTDLENKRLREALLKLRKITFVERTDLLGRIQALEGVGETSPSLQLEHAELKKRNENSQSIIEELKRQLENLSDSENTTQRLWEKDETFGSNIADLKILNDLNHELAQKFETREQSFIMQLQSKDLVICRLVERYSDLSSSASDLRKNINMFRDRCEDLKKQMITLRAENTEIKARRLAHVTVEAEKFEINRKMILGAQKQNQLRYAVARAQFDAELATKDLEIAKDFLPTAISKSILDSISASSAAQKLHFICTKLIDTLSQAATGYASSNFKTLGGIVNFIQKLISFARCADLGMKMDPSAATRAGIVMRSILDVNSKLNTTLESLLQEKISHSEVYSTLETMWAICRSVQISGDQGLEDFLSAQTQLSKLSGCQHTCAIIFQAVLASTKLLAENAHIITNSYFPLLKITAEWGELSQKVSKSLLDNYFRSQLLEKIVHDRIDQAVVFCEAFLGAYTDTFSNFQDIISREACLIPGMISGAELIVPNSVEQLLRSLIAELPGNGDSVLKLPSLKLEKDRLSSIAASQAKMANRAVALDSVVLRQAQQISLKVSKTYEGHCIRRKYFKNSDYSKAPGNCTKRCKGFVI